MGGMIICDKACLGVMSIFINLTWLRRLSKRGFVPVEFLSEHLPLGRKGEFRESLSLHLLFFKHLQPKTIYQSSLFGDGMS